MKKHPGFAALLLGLLALAATGMAAPTATDGAAVVRHTVLAVDEVGRDAALSPAGDLLAVELGHRPGDGRPVLRLSFLALSGDGPEGLARAFAAAGDPAAIRVAVQQEGAGPATRTTFALNRQGHSYVPAADPATGLPPVFSDPADPDAVYLLLDEDPLAAGSATFTITTVETDGSRDTVKALYPPARDYQAHCALVLHCNQGIGYTDVLHGRGDDLDGSGFDEALQVHQGTGVPGNFHLSGTLMTAAEWAANSGDPVDFNAWLAAGVTDGWAGMVSSAYGQHMMPFVTDDMNHWSVQIQAQMVESFYGYTPRVAWVPERVWLNTAGYPSSGVNDWIGDNWLPHGIQGVILDDDVHLSGHDNHRIHTLAANGLRLIPRDRSFTGNIIGGNGQGSLDILASLAGSGLGQYRIAVFAEDWEAVAEMGGWADTTPQAKETYDWFVNKCATESAWLHTWKLADALANPDFTGDTMDPTPGTYHEIGGFDGYGGADNAWYTHWAGFVPYANGGDGSGGCDGQSGGNCKDYGTLWYEAYDALMNAPDNDISQAGWYVLMTNLHETAWHDYLGGPISGWQHRYSAHMKNAMIYAEAARWADGQYLSDAAAYFSDIDNDGYDELVVHSDRLFGVFEKTGGRLTHLFVKGDGYADTAIGVDNAYWAGTEGDYNDVNHIAAFSDVGPDHQHAAYQLEILDGDGADGDVTVRATHLEVSKEITLRNGETWLDAVYRVGFNAHWIQGAWSPSLVDLVWNAQLERVWRGGAQPYMGHHNPDTGLTVGWVLGLGEAGHQKELSATLSRGDEIVADGTFEVLLHAGPTSAPVDGQVAELHDLAVALTDTIGPRVDFATWHPNGQLEVYFDQPITDTTADSDLMGFDDDGDGIPEVSLAGIAYPAPVGFVWFVMVSVDPAHVDAINALDRENLQIVLQPGAIEDWHGNANPLTTGPVTVYPDSFRVTLDGHFAADEWTDFALLDAGDSEWTGDNEIEAVHVTWDNTNLYLGIEGIVTQNSWVLYLDTDPGGPGGETDLTAIDTWERGAVFTAPGFAADWQYGAYQHQSEYDGQSFWKIESPTTTGSATGTVQMAFDPNHLHGSDGGSELAIPWVLLYGLGADEVPPGAQISLVASVCWDPEPDGELGGDSAPSNLAADLPVIDNVWTVTIDGDGDGHPDVLDVSAVPPAVPAGSRLLPNVPNPFNPSTTIRFTVGGASAAHVELAIYDLRGRLVRTLLDDAVAPGRHDLVWDGRSADGRAVAAGTYLCRMQSRGQAWTRPLSLIK